MARRIAFILHSGLLDFWRKKEDKEKREEEEECDSRKKYLSLPLPAMESCKMMPVAAVEWVWRQRHGEKMA